MRKKLIIALSVFVLISVLAELFVFNFEYFASRSSSPQEITFTEQSDADGDCYIAKNIDSRINYFYLDTLIMNDDFVRDSHIDIYAKDEGRSSFYKMARLKSYPDYEKTKYIHLNSYGKIKELKLVVANDSDYSSVEIKKAEINVTVPMSFSVIRVLLLTLILLFLYAFRTSSSLYCETLLDSRNKVKLSRLKSVFILLNALILLPLIFENYIYLNDYNSATQQYGLLAQAICEGRVNIDVEHLELIEQLSNPYDFTLRTKVLNENGLMNILVWDIAYFKGNAYVYFGIVPVLVFYLPWYIITGKVFSSAVAVLITSILIIFEGYRFIDTIVKTYFKKTSFGVQMLVSFVFVNSSGIISICQTPSFYFLPILMSFLFTIIGLRLWITAKQRIVNNEPKGKTYFQIAVASLFMALNAGCRPQFLIASFLIVPIFWDVLIKDRKIHLKENYKYIICVAVPYLLVAAGVMYYNYIRFESPFDFGANYNLTTNDMRLRGYNLFRIPDALFSYFLQTPEFVPYFPYIKPTATTFAYAGMTIYEEMFGGVLFCQSFVLLSFAICLVKKRIKDLKLYPFFIMLIVMSVIVALCDAEMSGILSRYYFDFLWMLVLAAVFVTLALFEKYSNNRKLTAVVCVLVFSSLVFDFAIGFGTSRFNIFPQGYYFVYSMLT